MSPFEYKNLAEINRGVRNLSQVLQAQGSGGTVSADTYRELFDLYVQIRDQLDEATRHSDHWKSEAERFLALKEKWVVYADAETARADRAEAELDRLKLMQRTDA